MNGKFFTKQVGKSMNAQFKVMQVSENRFEIWRVVTDEFVGFADNQDFAVDAANQHEANEGKARKRFNK